MPDSGKWQRIQTPECISFLFPNTPEKIVNTNNGIRSTIYQTKDLTCVFGIVCSDMSSKKIRITSEYAQILYEELKKGSLSIETAILKEEKTIPYENMIIKEIQYSIYKDKYEMTYIKRFIFRDNYIYLISIGGRTRHMSVIQNEMETFFNSISFHDPTEKINEVQNLFYL